jgi:quinol monooxygenase YgiN
MAEGHAGHANEASAAAVYVVAYVEVMPASATEAAVLLRRYGEASRADAGLMELEVLQQCGRPDHLAVVASWQDQPSFEAHGSAAHTRAMHESLQSLRSSPYDERLHRGFSLGAGVKTRVAGAIYVLTHADAIPPARDDAMVILNQLAEMSRHDEGCVRFDVLQQHSRLNHLTIVEIWRDQEALDAHVIAAHTREFRERFQPMSGSLYDERLYLALDTPS